jgi:hypothetical protein
MIVIARDIQNDTSTSLPFFPTPSKICTLQLLVHLIATTIQSSAKDVLAECRDEQMELVGFTPGDYHEKIWNLRNFNTIYR